MNANAASFASPAAYAAVKGVHKEFHECAGEIAILIEQHAPHESIAFYLAAFDDLSKRLVDLIRQVRDTRQT
jgi:hypothetical protein